MLEPLLPLDAIGQIDPQNYALWQGTTIDASAAFDPKTFDWDACADRIKSQGGIWP